MYEKYWNLKLKPFGNTPDPRFLYYSQKHKEAVVRMIYAVKERKGAAMLTGELGCGKTMISRIILRHLGRDKFSIGLITNPGLCPNELINEIIYQLDTEVIDKSKPELQRILNDILYRNMKNGKNTVIIIDESQRIEDTGTFEELRLLLNFQLNDRFLLTLLLLGQPELKEKVMAIPQFDQRIEIRYHLERLDKRETAGYIRHRIKIAGREELIFNKEAVENIYDKSKGVPRIINTICDMGLLVGYGRKKPQINEDIINEVSRDIFSPR